MWRQSKQVNQIFLTYSANPFRGENGHGIDRQPFLYIYLYILIQFFPGREYINSVQEKKKRGWVFVLDSTDCASHFLGNLKVILGRQKQLWQIARYVENLRNLSVKALHLLAYGPWRKSCMHNYCWAKVARSPLFSRIRE
jgi:hypothetical protein